MKVTATKCIDGKRHNWEEAGEGEYNNYRGCSKCGSITEFFNDERCISCNKKDIKKYGKYYIQVPKCLERIKE